MKNCYFSHNKPFLPTHIAAVRQQSWSMVGGLCPFLSPTFLFLFFQTSHTPSCSSRMCFLSTLDSAFVQERYHNDLLWYCQMPAGFSGPCSLSALGQQRWVLFTGIKYLSVSVRRASCFLHAAGASAFSKLCVAFSFLIVLIWGGGFLKVFFFFLQCY